MEAVNSNDKTITESLVTGDLLLALFWESFRILKLARCVSRGLSCNELKALTIDQH